MQAGAPVDVVVDDLTIDRLARPGFRADIEGMRAIAVVVVILFHARVPGFEGGFVGVDVFFVLSGFLITGLLAAERAATSSISLGRFYARRARRLLPASWVVVMATLAGTTLVGNAIVRHEAAVTARWVVAFVANHRFVSAQAGYFAEGTTPSPFLHFWSLAVEEQYYLVWPALILLVGLGAAGSVALRERLLGALGVLTGASFLACVFVTDRWPNEAFYLLPTRAWELGIGGLVAVAGLRVAPRFAVALSVAGLAGIAVAVATFDASTVFPGSAAALPVLATAALVVGGTGGGRGATTVVQRALSVRPMQRIGAYSYSLYLWHWPVIVLAGLAAPRIAQSWQLTMVAVVVVAVPAAIVSFRYVEDPIRRDRELTVRPSLAMGGGLIALALVASVVAGAGLRFDAGRPAEVAASGAGEFTPTDYVPDDLRPGLLDASTDLPAMYSARGCDWRWETTAAEPCVFGDAEGAVRVVLFGDSHAGQWSDPLREIASARGWRLETLVTPGCSAMSYPQARTECVDWRNNALDLLTADPPDLVVVVDSGFRLYPRDPATWEDGVRHTIGRLADATTVVLVGETSRPPSLATECLADHLADVRPCEPDPFDAGRVAIIASEKTITTDLGAAMIDPTPMLCWSGRCPAVVGDVLVYRDASHMTRTFSLLRTDELAGALDSAWPGPRSAS